MAKSNTIIIDYVIKTLNQEFSYREFFKPFSNKEFDWNTNSLFFSKEIDLDLDSFFKNGIEYINEERILPETPDIILDMIYAVAHISYYYPNLELPFFMNKSDYKKYIGIYTELLKQDIYKLKRDLSFLLNVYFFNEEDDSLDKKLSEIKHRYHLSNEITYKKKESIKEAVFYLLNLKNINQNNVSIKYEIDFSKVDRFITLLKSFNKKDYIIGYGCFCLVKADSNWYFSISGTNPEYNNLGKKLEGDISQYFKHSKFKYCGLTDNVLSYGDIVTTEEKLNKYEIPIPYSDAKKNFKLDRIKEEYRCCERKIFPFISSSKREFVICKYDPCPRCVPAVINERENKESFLFKSFAHGVDDFAKYLNKEKTKLIHKLELGIVNDI